MNSQIEHILNGYDFNRLVECIRCPYFDRCTKDVPKPEDDSDGTCKTRKEYELSGRAS